MRLPITGTARTRPPTVLVIDDHPDIRGALELGLTMEGFGVTLVPDRDTALEAIEEEPPQVILMDYTMPGLKADEFLQSLRSKRVRSEVVLVTGISDPMQKAAELGLRHWLQKPFEYDELVSLLHRFTDVPQIVPSVLSGPIPAPLSVTR